MEMNTDRVRLPPRPLFDPKLVFDETTSRNEFNKLKGNLKLNHKIKLGLLNILQVRWRCLQMRHFGTVQIQSELNVPKRIAQHQLGTEQGKRQLDRLIAAIIRYLDGTNGTPSFFFLGIGTSVPLITTIEICQNAMINGCTNHPFPFLSKLVLPSSSFDSVRPSVPKRNVPIAQTSQ